MDETCQLLWMPRSQPLEDLDAGIEHHKEQPERGDSQQ